MAKRRLAITAALAAFAIVLTGCSSSDSSADGFVGVILPDAASSNRWETADRGFLQAAFDAAGVTGRYPECKWRQGRIPDNR